MDHFDDLPKHHSNRITESKAEAALQNLLSKSEDFVLQASDRKDYGADCQIEVIDRGSATNVRIHVQLKGTEKTSNADGSISVEISRPTLNYLLMQPYSLLICYHVPSDMLRFCTADAVLRKYEHSGQSWHQQQTVTVALSEILTDDRLRSLAALVRTSTITARNMRLRQTAALPNDIPEIIRSAVHEIHVPEDKKQAAAVLSSLYGRSMDHVISVAFEKFESILGDDHDAMNFCYMAEINLGMAGSTGNVERIEKGISYLASKLDAGRFYAGSIHYSIGNGLSALGREEEAARAYEVALESRMPEDSSSLLAQCYKNLGSSYEKLGDRERAADSYRKALAYDNQLPEAHYALGLFHLKNGDYSESLEHFDQTVFPGHSPEKQSSMSGWRLNALFNLGDGKAAFREINALLGDADSVDWIWPQCARLISGFGRTTPENARLSIPFWRRYLEAHPNCPSGSREILLNQLYLRLGGYLQDQIYLVFKKEFEAGIQYVQGESAALLWDRLGHWAQEEKNWEEAERCFRVAYDLAGGHYGYCLGTALLFLDRPEESLPLLLSQAKEIQPDETSWFQVASAYDKLGRVREAIDAYQHAITLNPDYALAWFDMGGTYWNAGEMEQASEVWKTAVKMFPDHELADRLRRELPFVLL